MGIDSTIGVADEGECEGAPEGGSKAVFSHHLYIYNQMYQYVISTAVKTPVEGSEVEVHPVSTVT